MARVTSGNAVPLTVVGPNGRYYDLAMEAIRDSDGDGRVLVELTAREKEVLHRTALGQTNAQVAAGLGVSVHAVKFHLSSIFRKLSVHNRTEATAVYLQHLAGWPR